MRVLFIDNFDPSIYNLVEEFEKKDCEVLVYRNDVDMKTIDAVVKKFRPSLIVICSGASPKYCGNSKDIIITHHAKIPIFGIGSGHNCVIEAFEGKVGKSPGNENFSKIKHDGKTIFKNLKNPFQARVYNSLAGIDISYDLEVTSRSENDVVMGVRHKEHFVEGIQFDPSSILTPDGSQIIENLIKEIRKK
jgi:anthranilate synthase/aminodeoxychorismate synthase-like glutamine amidotransferase